MSSYKCPKCASARFIVSAHVVQGWLVGEHGEWLETTNECEQVTHHPQDDDVWVCASCGYDASGSEMKEVAC